MAVQVSRSRHGYLALRIFWRGRDQWVGTKLRDDGEGGKNRRRLEAKAILISERLEAGDELLAVGKKHRLDERRNSRLELSFLHADQIHQTELLAACGFCCKAGCGHEPG